MGRGHPSQPAETDIATIRPKRPKGQFGEKRFSESYWAAAWVMDKIRTNICKKIWTHVTSVVQTQACRKKSLNIAV